MGESTVQCVGERLSFSKLFNRLQLNIEIPIIQRDYAQGRASCSEVRKEFLGALFRYLEENKPNRDLDFIYGTIQKVGKGHSFIPLDGQQRLTTLFLLHWYLASISENTETLRALLMESGKSRFTYKTRFSSSEFCDALMGCNINMDELLKADKGEANSLSKTIRDQSWFYLTWENDPTIVAMLTMLDDIHQEFYGNGHFFKRLVDSENPIITFLFLDLEKFNLTDDLYIKMNARGKPLTEFENFKAKLEQRIRKFRSQLPLYTLTFNDVVKEVDGYDYFIHKIDTDWANLFWNYRNAGSVDDNFDDELMNLIRLVLTNAHILSTATRKEGDVPNLFGDAGRLRSVSFADYDDLEILIPDVIVYLIKLLDLLDGENTTPDGKIQKYLASEKHYSEHRVFEKVVSNGSSYPEKLRFYALYTYLMQKKEGVDEWMRVIYNLTENQIYNTWDDYKKSLVAIDELVSQDKPILELLKNEYTIKSFREAQLMEERMKACLITKHIRWEKQIHSIEEHPFFRGQVGFILSFSGITDFYQKYGHCNWPADQDDILFDKFDAYAMRAAAVFSLIGESSATVDYLWERAVLCKGDYTTKASASRYNLLCTRESKNNIERDYSWRRLFRLAMDVNGDWFRKQSYVKAVLDDPDFNSKNIKNGLKSICDNALLNASLETWQKKLIEYPALFSLCKQGFISRTDEYFYLFHQSQRNHWHSELFTKILEFKLQVKNIDFGPFKNKVYLPSKNSYSEPRLRIEQWKIEERDCAISICFTEGKYKISFMKENGNKGLPSVDSVLLKHGFKASDEYEEVSHSHVLFCDSDDDTLDTLDCLFEDLRKIS